jgi:hypothetical protein
LGLEQGHSTSHCFTFLFSFFTRITSTSCLHVEEHILLTSRIDSRVSQLPLARFQRLDECERSAQTSHSHDGEVSQVKLQDHVSV